MPKNIVPKGADWNFGPGSLWTHRGWQYAAYWDDACQVSVARRRLPDGLWSVVSLPGYQRTTNLSRGRGGEISKGFGDGHEKVSLGISPDGFIHLAFDHHVSTLHYRRSLLPVAENPAAYSWSPGLFGPLQDHLGGPSIEGVTYPSFTSDGQGFTLYLRLNGGSGSADSHFFEYANGRWAINSPKASKLIDKNWSGGDRTVSAYPFGLTLHNGRRHLAWCWRDTPDASTCHDLCYAYSDDNGRTWLNNAGQVIGITGEKCITADSPGVAVWKIPPGTKYVNGGSMLVDEGGMVHVLARGETGAPVHFLRDATTSLWSRQKSPAFGTLIGGQDNWIYLASEDGLHRASASQFGKMEMLVPAPAELFKDSRMAVDRMRVDAWISVIGQTGRKISVVDYRVGERKPPQP
jgi:hypothetical protein